MGAGSAPLERFEHLGERLQRLVVPGHDGAKDVRPLDLDGLRLLVAERTRRLNAGGPSGREIQRDGCDSHE